MPVNTTQVANVVMSDTFTQFANKTNVLIKIVNGLPAVKRDPLDRRGGTIDGGEVGEEILQGDNGSLFIINPDPANGNRGLGIGDFLSSGFPTSVGEETQFYILKSDRSASINVVSTFPGGTANLNLQGTGNSAVRFLENSTDGMVIGYDDEGAKLDIRQFISGTETDRFTFTRAGRLGIGTNAPTYKLDVVGNIGLGDGGGTDYLYHNDDDNTYILFHQDEITFAAGGRQFIKMHEDDTQDILILGAADTDVDTAIYRNNSTAALFVEGSSGQVGIGTIGPGKTLDVVGTFRTSGASLIGGTLGVTGVTTLSEDVTIASDKDLLLQGSGTLTVGTGATTLGGALDVTGATTLGGALDVTGTTTLRDDVTIASNKDLSLSGTGTLTVGTGLTDLGGALTVDGATTLNEDVTIASNKDLLLQGSGTLTVGTGLVDLGGALTVDGATTLNEDVTIASNKDLLLQGSGTLTVGTGLVDLGGALTVDGATTLNDNLALTSASHANVHHLRIKGALSDAEGTYGSTGALNQVLSSTGGATPTVKWKSLAELGGSGTVGGSSAAGVLARWTGTDTIEGSIIQETAGGLIGIGGVDNGFKLKVHGTFNATSLATLSNGLTVSAGATTLTNGTLSVPSALTTLSSLKLTGTLEDSADSTGTDDYVLTRVASGVEWKPTLSAFSGSAGVLPIFGSGGMTIEDSVIKQVSTSIGINEELPDQMLHVTGTNPQIILWESDTEFVRLGVENTAGDMVLGWDDADDMQFGVFTSPTDADVTSHMTIEAGGDVGIGTTNPGKKLDVVGTFRASGASLFSSTLGITGVTSITDGTAAGTLDPFSLTGALRVTGGSSIKENSQFGGDLRIHGDAIIANEPWSVVAARDTGALLNMKGGGSGAYGALGATAGDTANVWQSGTATSSRDTLVHKLERTYTHASWDSAIHKIQRLVDDTWMGYIGFGHNGFVGSGNNITFGEGSTEYMVIDGDGDVGIGISTPLQKLHIEKSGSTQIAIAHNDNRFLRLGVGEISESSVIGWDNADELRLGTYVTSSTTTLTTHMNITPAGKVFVGRDSGGLPESIGSGANPVIAGIKMIVDGNSQIGAIADIHETGSFVVGNPPALSTHFSKNVIQVQQAYAVEDLYLNWRGGNVIIGAGGTTSGGLHVSGADGLRANKGATFGSLSAPVRKVDIVGAVSGAILRLESNAPTLEFYENDPGAGDGVFYWRLGADGGHFVVDRAPDTLVGDPVTGTYTSARRPFSISGEQGNTSFNTGPGIVATSSKVSVNGAISLSEQASSQVSATSHGGAGQIWVKNTNPTELMFTDDTAVDHNLLSSSGLTSSAANYFEEDKIWNPANEILVNGVFWGHNYTWGESAAHGFNATPRLLRCTFKALAAGTGQQQGAAYWTDYSEGDEISCDALTVGFWGAEGPGYSSGFTVGANTTHLFWTWSIVGDRIHSGTPIDAFETPRWPRIPTKFHTNGAQIVRAYDWKLIMRAWK